EIGCQEDAAGPVSPTLGCRRLLILLLSERLGTVRDTEEIDALRHQKRQLSFDGGDASGVLANVHCNIHVAVQ
ncbi:MAG: hypothetical protein WAL02_07680, partial [Rhodoplanes sp.]